MLLRVKHYCIIIFLLSSTIICSQSDKIAEINNLLTLNDEAFVKALNDFSSQYYYGLIFNTHNPIKKENYTRSDTLQAYWSFIKKIINITPTDFHDRFGATRSLEQILYDMILISGESEYPKLIEYYKSIPDTNYCKYDPFLIFLCNSWIKREIDYIIQNNIKSQSDFTSSQDYAIPSTLSLIPSELYDDWNTFNSLKEYYKYSLDKDTTCQWYYVQKHYDLFQKKIEEILISYTHEKLYEVMRFRWGGWCGTGSEGFSSERQIAILISLMRNRDFAAILGNPGFTDNIGYKNFRKLIELCGYDWIEYYAGMMCDGSFNQVSPEYYKQGGDKAASLLIKMKNYPFKNIYDKESYLWLCSDFLKKEKKSDYFPNFDFYANLYYSNEYENDYENRVAISEETRNHLLKTIIDLTKDEKNVDVVNAVIKIFSGLDFNPIIKEQLLSYTKSEYKSVRDGAAKILEKNQISVELPEDDGKVKFRILVDGVPLPNFNLGYELEGSSSSFGYYSRNGKTTDKGIFNLNKDELLDTKKDNQRIRFSSNSGAGKSQMLFFCTDMIIPENISDTIDVFISTGRLRINFNLNRDKSFYMGKKMSIYFSGSQCQLHYLELSDLVQESYFLPLKVQLGKFYLSISIPGSKDWHDFLEINSDTTTLLVDLYPGTSVKFKIKAPGGEKSDQEVSFKLIHNNIIDDYGFAYYNYNLDGYESLPVGTYTLKIFSSKEKKARIKENSSNSCDEIIPEYVDYEGKELSFTIDSNSPEIIDFGTIELVQSEE
jgi:hypothetical protein